MNPRRAVAFVVSLAVTAVFLVLALRSVDLGRLAQTYATANYGLVGLATLCTLCGYLLRTKRWQRFLAPTKSIPVPRLFPVLIVGFALNNLLPGRPGEFARPYWLGRREELSKTLGFATIIVERVADGVALIAILLLGFGAFAPLGIVLPPAAETIAVGAGLIFGVALVGLVLLVVRPDVASALLRWGTRFFPPTFGARLEKMLNSFVLGLHSLRSRQDVAAIVILSLAVWTAEGTSYVLMLSAFGALPSPPVHLLAAGFMMVLINLGVMIPAAPGGLGPFEAAGVFALSVFAVSQTGAVSVSLASHAMQYLLVTGLGLFFIWRAGMSITQPSDETEP